MARKSKAKSKSRRTYKAPAKRRRAAPMRRTKKQSALRSRRRTKKNPKTFFQQPAVKFGLAATVGAGLSLAINNRQDLRIFKTETMPQGISGSYVAAALTIAAGQFFLKGRNRQIAYAAGVGMLLPGFGAQLGEGFNKLLPPKGVVSNGAGNSGNSSGKPQKNAPKLIRSGMSYTPRMNSGAKFAAIQSSTSRMKSA